MKVLKAVWQIYSRHLISVLLALVLAGSFLSATQNSPKLFSLITTLIYVSFVYSTAWNIGMKDSRRIPGFYPDKSMPVKLSLYTAIVPVLLFILRVAAPDIWAINIPFFTGEVDFFIKDFRIFGTPDFLYRMWFVCFAAFVPSGNLVAYALQLLILPILIFAGYFIGVCRFSLTGYLHKKLVFKNTPSNDENNTHNR